MAKKQPIILRFSNGAKEEFKSLKALNTSMFKGERFTSCYRSGHFSVWHMNEGTIAIAREHDCMLYEEEGAMKADSYGAASYADMILSRDALLEGRIKQMVKEDHEGAFEELIIDILASRAHYSQF